MKVKVKVAQSCLTLCNAMDYIVHGILQARILELVVFAFSRVSSQPRIEPRSPALLVDSYQLSHKGSPGILEWVAYPFMEYKCLFTGPFYFLHLSYHSF